MSSLVRPAIVLFVLLSVMTGAVYPLVITGIAQVFFPDRASGSVILSDGTPVGSSLIGQEFSQGEGAPRYFWGRLSATAPAPYTAFNGGTLTGSSGSNLAPTNPVLIASAQARIDALAAADEAVGYERPGEERIPIDLVTASASGLDPHVSIAAAQYQVPRVARARGLSEDAVRAIVRQHTQRRSLAILGEPVVNVLELNLALDGR